MFDQADDAKIEDCLRDDPFDSGSREVLCRARRAPRENRKQRPLRQRHSYDICSLCPS